MDVKIKQGVMTACVFAEVGYLENWFNITNLYKTEICK